MDRGDLAALLLDAAVLGARDVLDSGSAILDSKKITQWINEKLSDLTDKDLDIKERFMYIKVSVETDGDECNIHVAKKVHKLNELEMAAAKFKILEVLSK